MAISVLIPTPLRKLTNEQESVTVEASSINDVIDGLDTQFPGMRGRLVDDTGGIRKFINLYVNEEDVRFLQGADTAVKDGDTVSIVPAIAGGY
jgi:molybdopterin synthase sulfur carrier subunit